MRIKVLCCSNRWRSLHDLAQSLSVSHTLVVFTLVRTVNQTLTLTGQPWRLSDGQLYAGYPVQLFVEEIYHAVSQITRSKLEEPSSWDGMSNSFMFFCGKIFGSKPTWLDVVTTNTPWSFHNKYPLIQIPWIGFEIAYILSGKMDELQYRSWTPVSQLFQFGPGETGVNSIPQHDGISCIYCDFSFAELEEVERGHPYFYTIHGFNSQTALEAGETRHNVLSFQNCVYSIS